VLDIEAVRVDRVCPGLCREDGLPACPDEVDEFGTALSEWLTTEEGRSPAVVGQDRPDSQEPDAEAAPGTGALGAVVAPKGDGH
jgi:hypothetical protein